MQKISVKYIVLGTLKVQIPYKAKRYNTLMSYQIVIDTKSIIYPMCMQHHCKIFMVLQSKVLKISYGIKIFRTIDIFKVLSLTLIHSTMVIEAKAFHALNLCFSELCQSPLIGQCPYETLIQSTNLNSVPHPQKAFYYCLPLPVNKN